MNTAEARPLPIILAVLTGVAIYGFAMGTTYPLLGIVLSDIVSDSFNGVNASATGLGLLSGVMLVPFAARRLGAGGTAVLGVSIMAASLTAMSLTRDFWTLFAARFLLGIGANFMFVIAETALNVFSPAARRGQVMGLYAAVTALGFVIGPGVVALFPNQATWLLAGCACITATAFLPLMATRRPVDRALAPSSVAAMVPAVMALPFAFGFLFIASAVDAIVISLLPIVAARQGFDLSQGAWFVAVFHLGLLCGQPLIGVWLDWQGRLSGILLCCFLSAACSAGLLFSAALGFWATAGLMLIWGGSNFGLYTAGLALIGDRFKGASLTAATAAFAGVYALASSLSPAVASTIIDRFSPDMFYGALAALYLACLAVAAGRFRPAEPLRSRGNA